MRMTDARIACAGEQSGEANQRVLTGGKAGVGRVTETAGVRGIDESDLKAAALDQTQLDEMIGYRADSATAAAYAREHGWEATAIAYAAEATPGKRGDGSAEEAESSREILSSARGMLGSLGQGAGWTFGATTKLAPKPEAELAAEEDALGPQIAGRVLGARPLLNDAAAQKRVNLIGRWMASQTSRPELPWTFGVIDTPDVNAYAAPGGFILVGRGLYELLSSDAEVAAVLGHEISHCVQRDHYDVIRKQEITTAVKDRAMESATGADGAAGAYARQYAEKHGATIVLTSLDRSAEFRSDGAAEIYLARAGMNPQALYAVLQKMAALGTRSPSLAQLYKTHPALDARLDRIDRRNYAALEAYTRRE